MALRLAALLALFPACAFVPGFLLVRRFDLPEALRLPVSVAVSIALLYVAGFALYLLGAGAPAYVAVAVAILAAGAALRRDLAAFARAPEVRAAVLHWAIFAAWLLLASLLVRNFSGGGWAGDWLEHYDRARFFLGDLPLDTRFIGLWSLPARPPLQNVVEAFFMGVAGSDFAIYQLAAVLLASLQILGASSLWLALARGRGERLHAGLLVLTALLALNPSVVQNATYPWTRALTNFFLLQAAALLVLALRNRSPALRRWSALHLGLALVTHYSTVPYLAALAAVEGYLLVRRRASLRETGVAASIVAAPAAPWLAFALARFGLAGTFLANSTVEWNASLGPAGILRRALGNFVRTLVPHVFRQVPPEWAQEDAWGRARDYAFLVYQVSLPALLGSAGAAAVAWLLGSAALRRWRAGDREVPALAATFLAIVVVLGIATVADDDAFGVAHVCLQPLAVAGLVYLAARWTSAPAWLRAAVLAGAAFDAAAGIGLQLWMEHLGRDDLLAMNPAAPPVSATVIQALVAKLQLGLVFLGDLEGSAAAVALLAVALAALVAQAARVARRGPEALRPPAGGPAPVP